jgi:hypothetical protein
MHYEIPLIALIEATKFFQSFFLPYLFRLPP